MPSRERQRICLLSYPFQTSLTLGVEDEHAASDQDVELALKYTSYSICALDFDDIPTAIRYLQEALSALYGEVPPPLDVD